MAFTSPGMAVPPVATVYQRYCPLVPPDALSTTEAEGPHEEPGDVEGGGGTGLMVAVTATRVLSHVPSSMET